VITVPGLDARINSDVPHMQVTKMDQPKPVTGPEQPQVDSSVLFPQMGQPEIP
jgi:hypothetical protein